ncbi:MAG: pantetheine-phosphate adenylyltransferase [Candidatus Omnitrophica bacterium]|nr:pantetheine-phosphate adenylyltransferase [Candidatus Omnitrophota bacterium]
MPRVALYPGSFDPVTLGHVDLIKRAAHMYDKVVVAVANNLQKKPLFDIHERVKMLQEATRGIRGIEVVQFQGLVVDFAKKNKIAVLIRGLRMISDFEYEFQMALTNRRLAPNVETVFLMPSEKFSFLSSTLLKEAASLGADVSSFVPKFVQTRLKKKLKDI